MRGRLRGACWRIWVIRILAVEIILALGVVTLLGQRLPPIQSQDAINVLAEAGRVAIERRVDVLDRRFDGHEERILKQELVTAVLVSDMGEVKWLGRAVATAVAGQLIILGFGPRKRLDE